MNITHHAHIAGPDDEAKAAGDISEKLLRSLNPSAVVKLAYSAIFHHVTLSIQAAKHGTTGSNPVLQLIHSIFETAGIQPDTFIKITPTE